MPEIGLSNLAELGFHDLRAGFHEQEQRSYFKTGQRPYQLDHLFADAVTAASATGWTVRPEPVEVGKEVTTPRSKSCSARRPGDAPCVAEAP